MEAASTPCFVDAALHKPSGLVQFETSEILKGILKVRVLGLFERPRDVVKALQSPARTGRFELANGRLVQESVVWSKRVDLRRNAHFVILPSNDVASVDPCEIPAACRTPHRFAVISKRPTRRRDGNFAMRVAGLRASLLDIYSISVLGCSIERPDADIVVPLYEWMNVHDIRPAPKKPPVEKWHFELLEPEELEEKQKEESKLDALKKKLLSTANDLEHLRSMPILTANRPKQVLHRPSNVAKLKASASVDDLLPSVRTHKRQTFLIVSDTACIMPRRDTFRKR